MKQGACLVTSARDVLEMERRLAARDASFDGSPETDEEEERFVPSGYLVDAGARPDEQLESDEDADLGAHHLGTALAALDARSRTIIERRWLAEKKSTLQELADEFGVSAERVRQIEQSALGRMRNAIAA